MCEDFFGNSTGTRAKKYPARLCRALGTAYGLSHLIHLCRRLSAVLKGRKTFWSCGRILASLLFVKSTKKCKKNEKASSISRVLSPPLQAMDDHLSRTCITAGLGRLTRQGSRPAPAYWQIRRSRNGPFPLSLPALFSLSSRRDCRVSPPVIFMTGTRLCGSDPHWISIKNLKEIRWVGITHYDAL